MSAVVTVILPVFNGAKYLDESIQSILNQTFTDYEFIIINDGSTDKSLNVINKYKKNDKRIQIINHNNKGLIHCLNEGIIKAKGKYIARMDADDICLPTRLEDQFNFMEANTDIGVCGTWAQVFGANNKKGIIKHPKYHEELVVKLLFSVAFVHPSVMIRKSVLDENSILYKKSYETVEDYELWYRLSKYTYFANIPKILLKYRYIDTSITRIADNAKNKSRYLKMKKIFNDVLTDFGMKNTEEENILHYNLSYIERMEKNTFDAKSVKIYFKKIITSNNQSKCYNKSYLKKFLGKKIFQISYFELKKKNFLNVFQLAFSELFVNGLLYVLNEKLLVLKSINK